MKPRVHKTVPPPPPQTDTHTQLNAPRQMQADYKEHQAAGGRLSQERGKTHTHTLQEMVRKTPPPRTEPSPRVSEKHEVALTPRTQNTMLRKQNRCI